MRSYLDILQTILDKGTYTKNRTGIDTIVLPGMIFEHDLADGFPLLTTKKTPYRLITSELEFFIKGITDKKWLIEKKNHIWDEWCSPEKVPYGHDQESKQKMLEERDLGPIYGFQWRNYGAKYQGYDYDYSEEGIDQLANLVNTLKENPADRRMLVNAWNPLDISKMALPPCHYSFQVTVTNEENNLKKINLMWNQRSVDTMIGLPFNIASYATMLHLLAKETGFEEGKLTGFLGDTHIYKNHLKATKEQLSREPFPLPEIITNDFKSIFDWNYHQTKLINYQSHAAIKMDIAV